MAKNKKKPTQENLELEKSDEVLTEVKTKPSKADKQKAKQAEKEAKAKKKAKAEKPKRHRIREIFSELKKVNWPTFKQACKQTGTVLLVVAIFMLVVLGIDLFLSWLISLLIG